MPVEPHQMIARGRSRRSPRIVAATGAAFGLSLSLILPACAKEAPTPEKLRRDRMESRLDATFPKAQASCILAGLDDATLQVLDRDADLPSGSAALRSYSFLVRACAANPEASSATTTGAGVTTTTTVVTTTTAPPVTTTTTAVTTTTRATQSGAATTTSG